jgi:PrtD family type I secretion system ABC transporter
MMQVYDRVMASHSLPTLAALLVVVVFLQAMQAFLLHIRQVGARRLADRIDEIGEARAFVSSMEPTVAAARLTMSPLQALQDIRAFIAGAGLPALMDLPWAVVFAGIMFLLHPWLGWVSLACTALIAGLALASEKLAAPLKAGAVSGAVPASWRDPFRDDRQAEMIRAQGLMPRFTEGWRKTRAQARRAERHRQAWPDALRTGVRVIRLIQPTLMLALAAYLTLENMATFGVMVASSIIAGRVSAPVDGVIGAWWEIAAARRAWPVVRPLLGGHREEPSTELRAAPSISLELKAVGARHPTQVSGLSIKDVALAVKAGERIGIIGPTGSGKSALLKAIAGAWPLAEGRMLLDGVDHRRWSRSLLASRIGYLPQDPTLLDGELGETIGRFASMSDETVVEAAKAAGLHVLIETFAEGYRTRITGGGRDLPPGFRARIAFASALHGNPFLLVLDNPTAQLDGEGERLLAKALEAHKARRGIAIVATSQAGLLMMMDRIVVMSSGRVVEIKTREEFFRPVLAAQVAAAAPLSVDPVNTIEVNEECSHAIRL